MRRLKVIVAMVLMMMPFISAHAQHEIRIQGVVRDLATSEPIGGVSVIYNGDQVAFTDIDGKYAAFVPNNADLLFYKPEYNDYTVAVDNRQIINVNMTVKLVELGESIVVGKMSKKTIVVDQTTLEVVGNYFHLKTNFRVPEQIFTTDKRFIVQPSLVNVTKEKVEWFRPVVMEGEIFKINHDRILGFEENEKDVLKPYVVENDLADTYHIYQYHDSLWINRDRLNDDFRAECYLAVNRKFENPKKDFLDTVIIARGTQNALRFFNYHIDPLELNDTSLIPKPEMKLVADKGVSRIGFLIGKAIIDKNNPQNEREMNAIKDKLLGIANDRNSTINAISVTGYASPDGSYKKNAILAQKRTDLVLNEIVSALPDDVRKYIKLSSFSIVEPWSTLGQLLTEDSLKVATQVNLAVKRYNNDYENTQRAIMRLPEYRSLIAPKYLPRLRRVEYEINSTVFRNLTVDEIWARYNNKEEDISRYEFWKLIESCTDPAQKENLEREALKKFKNFELIANREAVRLHKADSVNLDVLAPSVRLHAPLEINFNQTLMALKGGDIELADSLMRFLPTEPRTTYLKAIVNTMNGQFDDAYPYISSKGGLNEVLILLCLGRNIDADKKITALLEDEANWKDARMWYTKAVCANRLEDLNWAMEALTKAVTLEPKLIDVARLDADVMDVIEILYPSEQDGYIK